MGYHDQDKRNINKGTVMSHSRKLWHLRRATQLVLCVSVFSFLFFDYRKYLVLVPYKDYFYFYLSNLSFKVPFACTVERNCVFLLCNGILALIIRASGLISKIKPMSYSSLDRVAGKPESKNRSCVVDLQEKNNEAEIDDGEVQTDQSVEDHDDTESAEINKDDYSIQERVYGHEEEDEGEEVLSADELHKKCEDFIKKVKREISFGGL